MLQPKCPNCGAELDLITAFDFEAEQINFEVDIHDHHDTPPKLAIKCDDDIRIEVRISCQHCWWWTRTNTFADIDRSNKVPGINTVNSRIKPLPKGRYYDDATELWIEPGKEYYEWRSL